MEDKYNGKIAFLFLLIDNPNFPDIWDKYFKGNEDKINALIDFIKNNPGHSKVENIKISGKIIENFKMFEIRH